MREFANEKGDATVSDVFARPGSKYLVIDIGGKIELSEKWTVLTMSHYKISKPFLIFNWETIVSPLNHLKASKTAMDSCLTLMGSISIKHYQHKYTKCDRPSS